MSGEEESSCCNMCFTTWIAIAIGLYFLRKWFKGGLCSSPARLDGKTVLITGCNTGIGKETAFDLSRRGARVGMLCRNEVLANAAAEEIRKETNGDIVVYKCDLSSLKSIRECAKEILAKEEQINILINNAGVMWTPFITTEDGFELQMGTNHFGHFLLTNLLMDKIKRSGPARIINVSSLGHQFGNLDFDDLNWEKRKFNTVNAYGDSKLANIYFTKSLAQRLENSNVTVYALHPGAVMSDLGREIKKKIGAIPYDITVGLMSFFLKRNKEGAQTSIYCAVDESIAKASGKYYSDCAEKEPTALAQDMEKAEKLWELSEKAVGL